MQKLPKNKKSDLIASPEDLLKLNSELQWKMIELQGKDLASVKLELCKFLSPQLANSAPQPPSTFQLSGVQRMPDFIVQPQSMPPLPSHSFPFSPHNFSVQNPEQMPATFMMPENKSIFENPSGANQNNGLQIPAIIKKQKRPRGEYKITPIDPSLTPSG